MAKRKTYNQFCPVAMGAEIFAERWTPLVVRELLAGSTRFNDLRRGVPRISQSLLSQRLKELEDAGIVERRPDAAGRPATYHLTPMGVELRPIVEGLGNWAYRWVQAEIRKEHLDAGLLMWDMQRRIRLERLPERRVVVSFFFPDAVQGYRRYWLVLERRDADLCLKHPGLEVDLALEGDLMTMVRIWLGDISYTTALRNGWVKATGSKKLALQLGSWLALSPFAAGSRRRKPQLAWNKQPAQGGRLRRRVTRPAAPRPPGLVRGGTGPRRRV